MLLTTVKWSEDRIPSISKPFTVSGVGCYWTLVIKGNRNEVMSVFVNFQTLNFTSKLLKSHFPVPATSQLVVLRPSSSLRHHFTPSTSSHHMTLRTLMFPRRLS